MRASKRGTTLGNCYLSLLARLVWEELQIDTDLLPIITSTADELSGGTSIDDLEGPKTPKIGFFSDFFCDFRLQRILKENLCQNYWR